MIMKRSIIMVLAAMMVCIPVFSQEIIEKGLRFCESTFSYDGGLLVASFGSDQLNPLNDEGKGYITFFKDGKSTVIAGKDGNLSAPKGMFVGNGKLYVCDVNKIVVYDLKSKSEKPQIVRMEKDDLFVNDIVSDGKYLYVSVTNTGRIYRYDILKSGQLGKGTLWLTVPGPNGLAIRDGKMYIASYPADGVTTDDHVLYVVKDLASPVSEKLITIPGQYDGIAFSEDGKYLYYTNWTPAEVSVMDMTSGKVSALKLNLGKPLAGPADITVDGGYLYIPDLPASRVVKVRL